MKWILSKHKVGQELNEYSVYIANSINIFNLVDKYTDHYSRVSIAMLEINSIIVEKGYLMEF